LAKTDEFGEYKSGFNAIAKWISALRENLHSAAIGKFEEYEVNLTLFYCLLDCRRAAVEFLTSMNDLMIKGDLIINIYKKEIELLINGQKNILPSFESSSKTWTEDIINKQIDILTRILSLEKDAIDLIQEELKN